MGFADIIQTNFNAGVIGPKALGRIDVDKYDNGVRELKDHVVTVHGAALRRPAALHVDKAKTSSTKVALMPFEFNEEQAYNLEFGVGYIRFFRNKGQILGDGALTTVSIGGGGSGYTDGETVTITNSGDSWAQGTASVSAGAITSIVITSAGANFTVSESLTVEGNDSGANNATVTVASVTDDAIIELVTDYTEDQLYELRITQSADVLYLFHRDVPTKKITRYSHTDWTIENILFVDGPYFDENITATTLTAGAATGTGITLVASSEVGINGGDGFKSTDVGRLVRLRSGASVGYGVIASWVDSKNVTIDIEETVTTSAVTTWRLGSFSDTTGYPSVGTFYEQRFVVCATKSQRQTFWMSRTGLFETFSPTDLTNDKPDDYGLAYTLDSDKANRISWIRSGARLLLGTIGEEWQVSASRSTEAITPTNVSVRPQTSKGSALNTDALAIDSSIVFLSRSGRKVWDLFFKYEIDRFSTDELSVLGHNLVEMGGGLRKVVFQKEPNGLIWGIRNDGKLLSCTFNKDQKVIAWAEHSLGGTYQGGTPFVEDISVIPNPSAFGDELWLAVRYDVNGTTERHLLVLDDEFLPEDSADKEAMVFLDNYLKLDVTIAVTGATKANPCVLTLADTSTLSNGDEIIVTQVKGMTELNWRSFIVANKTSTTIELKDTTINQNNIDSTSFTTYVMGGVVRKKVSTVSGLGHLEGYTVGVLGDGIEQATQTVVSGSITLDKKAGLVYVGLPGETLIRLTKPEGGSPRGTSQDRPQRKHKVTLRVYNSINAEVSTDGIRWEPLPFRKGSDKMAQSPSLKSEDVSVWVEDDYIEQGGDIRVRTKKPYPLNILAIMWESVVY